MRAADAADADADAADVAACLQPFFDHLAQTVTL